MEKVFFLLGSKGAGKKELLYNLFESGFMSGEEKTVCISREELLGDFSKKLKGLEKTEVVAWDLKDGWILNCDAIEPGKTVFVVADGLLNPVDQLELWREYFNQKGWVVARIISVVDCRLLKHEALVPWFDACIHFSDAVLLNHRTDISNAAIKHFIERYQSLHFPCLFDYVKKGKVDNWEKVFNDEARRMTGCFDPEYHEDMDPSWMGDAEASFDLLNDDTEPDASKDPYFERRGDGVRKVTLPCVARFL